MTDYNIISVSGGKDSTATLLLALEKQAENLRAVFADTGHEHPATYDYLTYLETRLKLQIERIRPDFTSRIKAKRHYINTKWREEGVSENIISDALAVLTPTGVPFLDLCLWKGRFPSTRARFCTEELKRFPVFEQIFNPLLQQPETGEIFNWQGIRADESASRAKMLELNEDPQNPGLWYKRPILSWSAGDVFNFHRRHGVNWNPLYEQGMSRVGCMPCVMCRKDELREISLRYPEELERVKEWEHLVSAACKIQSSTFFAARSDPMVSSTDKIHFQTHGIARITEWAQTSHGGRQFDLITSLSPAQACQSAYGLCE